jgi:DNA-directed RNA polymerase subunit K/omega
MGSVVVEWREARALRPRRDRILIEVPSGVVDPIEIAWIEFNSEAILITVKRQT